MVSPKDKQYNTVHANVPPPLATAHISSMNAHLVALLACVALAAAQHGHSGDHTPHPSDAAHTAHPHPTHTVATSDLAALVKSEVTTIMTDFPNLDAALCTAKCDDLFGRFFSLLI